MKDQQKPPKPPPKDPGRPRNKGPRRIIKAARKKASETIAFLFETVTNEEEEMRYRLRAASELLRVAVLDFEEDGPALTEEDRALLVTFKKNWGGSQSGSAPS